jgi:cytochrome c6
MTRFRLRSTVLLGIVIVTLAISAPILVIAQSTPEPSASPAASDEAALIEMGESLYAGVCLACHQAEGAGVDDIYPALAGDPLVTLDDPRVVVQTILFGRGGMPRFNSTFSDEQIAGVASYIRNSFGNSAPAVSPEFVAQVRAEIEAGPEATPAVPEGGQDPESAEATPPVE